MKKIVLIVDDNDQIRGLLRRHFQTWFEDVTVREAKDGFEAIERVADVHPDLIILDMSMPRLNGLETAHRLRELEVETPLILFTLFVDETHRLNVAPSLFEAVASKTDLPCLYDLASGILATSRRPASIG